MRTILYLILILCAGAVAYSVSLPIFILSRQGMTSTNIIRDRTKKDFFIGKEIHITADDGQKFILQEINVIPESFYILYDREWRPYQQIYIPKEHSVVYVLMCENKTDILFDFEHFRDYFDEMSEEDYSLTITNIQKHENISTYEFTFDYKLPSVFPAYRLPFHEYDTDRITVKHRFWVDVKEHKYCGAEYSYRPTPIIEYDYTYEDWKGASYSLRYKTAPEWLTEYYNYTKDMQIGNVKEYFGTLYDYEEKRIKLAITMSYWDLDGAARRSMALISYFEPDLGKELQEELDMIHNDMADYGEFRRTMPNHYVGSVSELTVFYTKENTRGSKYYGKWFDDRVERISNSKIPNFDLPRNEEELAQYIAWLSEIYDKDVTVARFIDGTELKIQYNLTTDPEGLQAVFVDSEIVPPFREYK